MNWKDRKRNLWEEEVFALHLHKEMRIRGSGQVFAPHSQSDRGHGWIMNDRRRFFPLQFASLLSREVVGGAEIF